MVGGKHKPLNAPLTNRTNLSAVCWTAYAMEACDA